MRDYALLMLDPTGRIISWNPGAEAIKGYKADEIIGRHFSTFYPPESIERGLPARELVVAARDGRFEDEGWRDSQGRHALLGQRGHHRAAQSRRHA